MISAGTGGPSVQTTAAVQFWENVILRRKESQGNRAGGVFVASHMVPVTATTEPVAHFSVDDQQQAGSSGVSDIPQADDQDRPKKVQLGIEYEKLLLEQPGDSPVETSCHSPPFSQLLKEAVEHVDRTRQPLVFEGPTLQIIVQHKWESSCFTSQTVALFACSYRSAATPAGLLLVLNREAPKMRCTAAGRMRCIARSASASSASGVVRVQ